MLKINFADSHLFFPKIIITITLVLFIAMVIKGLPNRIRQIKSGNRPKFFEANYDKLKFYGTLILMGSYFKGMEIIGGFLPNTGYGFLISSIIFMFALSFLFVGKASKKQMIVLSLNSILTPALTWFLFGQMFGISLP